MPRLIGSCVTNPIRKPMDPPTIHVVVNISKLILGKIPKYKDSSNLIVIVQISKANIPNTLVNLGATINIMTMETLEMLGFTNIIPKPIVLELDDQ